MADISASCGALAPSVSPDPIHLHTQALNCLNRCKAMLLADEPLYQLAQEQLTQAQQAVAALHALDTIAAH